MNLPDFKLDNALNELRRTMGAKYIEFTPAASSGILTVEEIERLSKEGIEIPLDEVRVLRDGTLAYKNQRVVVYIRDVKQYRHSVPKEHDLPRFHISHCDKLQEMRANNRYQRYVVATRDSGVFQINLKAQNAVNYQTREERLRVCQYCLGKLNWDDFVLHRQVAHHRNRIVQSFTLQEYFKLYGKTFVEEMPNHTEQTAPLNDYTRDFKEIAERIKIRRNYRCDECGIDLSAHKKFLHAHHKNGIQSDNRESNIGIFCIEHHAEQFSHGHMKSLPDYREFMRLKTRVQFSNL